MKTQRTILGNLYLAGLFVLISACSSQPKSQEEPSISPIGDGATPEAAAPATGGPGDAGNPASGMRTVFFPFDSAVLTTNATDDLKANAQYMKGHPNISVQIEGHCDERGTVEYNLALGERRAIAAVRYMKKLGIVEGRMATISYGKERPSDGGHDEAAWARNRRDEFVVTGGQ